MSSLLDRQRVLTRKALANSLRNHVQLAGLIGEDAELHNQMAAYLDNDQDVPADLKDQYLKFLNRDYQQDRYGN